MNDPNSTPGHDDSRNPACETVDLTSEEIDALLDTISISMGLPSFDDL